MSDPPQEFFSSGDFRSCSTASPSTDCFNQSNPTSIGGRLDHQLEGYSGSLTAIACSLFSRRNRVAGADDRLGIQGASFHSLQKRGRAFQRLWFTSRGSW